MCFLRKKESLFVSFRLFYKFALVITAPLRQFSLIVFGMCCYIFSESVPPATLQIAILGLLNEAPKNPQQLSALVGTSTLCHIMKKMTRPLLQPTHPANWD